jgi:hypothetical protein
MSYASSSYCESTTVYFCVLLQNEWRGLGVQQSRGWEHYAIHRPEPHIMLFRCAAATDHPLGDGTGTRLQYSTTKHCNTCRGTPSMTSSPATADSPATVAHTAGRGYVLQRCQHRMGSDLLPIGATRHHGRQQSRSWEHHRRHCCCCCCLQE